MNELALELAVAEVYEAAEEAWGRVERRKAMRRHTIEVGLLVAGLILFIIIEKVTK